MTVDKLVRKFADPYAKQASVLDEVDKIEKVDNSQPNQVEPPDEPTTLDGRPYLLRRETKKPPASLMAEFRRKDMTFLEYLQLKRRTDLVSYGPVGESALPAGLANHCQRSGINTLEGRWAFLEDYKRHRREKGEAERAGKPLP